MTVRLDLRNTLTPLFNENVPHIIPIQKIETLDRDDNRSWASTACTQRLTLDHQHVQVKANLIISHRPSMGCKQVNALVNCDTNMWGGHTAVRPTPLREFIPMRSNRISWGSNTIFGGPGVLRAFIISRSPYPWTTDKGSTRQSICKLGTQGNMSLPNCPIRRNSDSQTQTESQEINGNCTTGWTARKKALIVSKTDAAEAQSIHEGHKAIDPLSRKASLVVTGHNLNTLTRRDQKNGNPMRGNPEDTH